MEYLSGLHKGLGSGVQAYLRHAEAGAMMYEWKLLRIDEPNNKFYIFTEMDKESAKRFKKASIQFLAEEEKKGT